MNREEYRAQDEKVERAKQGDPAATMSLYEDFLPLMKASIRKVGSPYLQAEDLLQTVSAEFLVALHDYDASTGVAFPAFLKSRFRYALLNEVRRWEKHRREASIDLPNDKGESWSEQLASNAATPEEAMITKEKHERLLTLLAALSEKERHLLKEVYQHKKTLRRISEETGEKLSTLKLRKRRAEEKLKERWNENEDLEK